MSWGATLFRETGKERHSRRKLRNSKRNISAENKTFTPEWNRIIGDTELPFVARVTFVQLSEDYFHLFDVNSCYYRGNSIYDYSFSSTKKKSESSLIIKM